MIHFLLSCPQPHLHSFFPVADTPLAVSIGRKAMSMLEVDAGVTVRQVFAKGWPEGFEGNLQIGRSPPLSSDKAVTHFPILHVRYLYLSAFKNLP